MTFCTTSTSASTKGNHEEMPEELKGRLQISALILYVCCKNCAMSSQSEYGCIRYSEYVHVVYWKAVFWKELNPESSPITCPFHSNILIYLLLVQAV